jgi:hypothetical protein
MGEINNFGRVAGEISDSGIDLAESNLHSLSVKAGGTGVETPRAEQRVRSVKIRDDSWLQSAAVDVPALLTKGRRSSVGRAADS